MKINVKDGNSEELLKQLTENPETELGIVETKVDGIGFILNC